MVTVSFRWNFPGLGPAMNIALIYDIILKKIIEQALGRNCHVCLISWVLARAWDDALTNRIYLPYQVQSADL